MRKFRQFIERLAALGAVKRKGLSGLESYGGTIEGKGHVISKKDGAKTEFVLEGKPAHK